MKRLQTVWILSILFLALSCQKRKYPDEKVQVGEEAIFFDGYVDNEPVSLKIGTDGYYCYSSYEQRADSIYVFEGELKKYNCNPCPSSLRVELTDYRKRSPGSVVPVDSALKEGSRHVIPGKIQFVSYSNKEVVALRWEYGSETKEDSVVSFDFVHAGLNTVSLTVVTKGGCQSTVANKIFVGESGIFAGNIIATPVQNNLSEFKPNVIGGKPPYTYSWSFGDGGTSFLSEPRHDYQWAGSYPVRLVIEDSEHHVCEANYIHVAGNDKSSCAANMSVSYADGVDAFLKGVRIQWTDRSNVVLRSDIVAQPAASYFEIVNSQDYQANERGEAGRLLTLRFNLLLSDGNRRAWIKSDNTAITVTYK